MLSKNILNSKLGIFLGLLLYSFVVLFFISPDSFLHDVYYRTDSAIFFMCGKAWMNGMTPYVDFADSKGPLLWLIYGVGYVINSYSYIGVYFVSCFFYAVTFFFAYKEARLFLPNNMKAICAAMFMIVPYFYYGFHNEVRAEDFCHPFVMACLYYFTQMILQPVTLNFKKSSYTLGLGIIACVLIKWSIGVMFVGFFVSILFMSIKFEELRNFVKYFCLGILSFAIPFGVYFLVVGNFDDFIYEYFLNTYKTVSEATLLETILGFVHHWLDLLLTHKSIFLFYLFFVIPLYKKVRWNCLLILLSALPFVLLSSFGNWSYYMSICSTFSIFFVLFLFEYFNKKTAPIYVLILIFCIYKYTLVQDTVFDDKYRKDYYDISYIMSQVKNPKIINEGFDNGLGLCVNALPGTKYWTRQNGETEFMKNSRLIDIEKGMPDFVFVTLNKKTNIDKLQYILAKANYVYYASVKRNDNIEIKAYGKPGLKQPDSSFQVSNTDLLLKRNLFNIK